MAARRDKLRYSRAFSNISTVSELIFLHEERVLEKCDAVSKSSPQQKVRKPY
jgi:hypothetical protein